MPTGTSYNDTSAVPAPAHAHDPVFGTPTAPGTLQPATALATSVPATAGDQPSVTTILPPPSLNVPHPNSPQALSSEDLSNSTVAALLAAGIQLQHQQRMNGDDFSCRRAGVGNHIARRGNQFCRIHHAEFDAIVPPILTLPQAPASWGRGSRQHPYSRGMPARDLVRGRGRGRGYVEPASPYPPAHLIPTGGSFAFQTPYTMEWTSSAISSPLLAPPQGPTPIPALPPATTTPSAPAIPNPPIAPIAAITPTHSTSSTPSSSHPFPQSDPEGVVSDRVWQAAQDTVSQDLHQHIVTNGEIDLAAAQALADAYDQRMARLTLQERICGLVIAKFQAENRQQRNFFR